MAHSILTDTPNSVSGGLFDLSGKIALITGGFGGLGRDFAQILGESGANLILAGRKISEGQRLVEALRQSGVSAYAVSMDVADPVSVDAAMAEMVSAVGVPDIVVNNAGITLTKPFLDLEESDWTSIMDVNLQGTWRVAQRTARLLQQAGKSGSIINIASILGLRVAQRRMPHRKRRSFN